MYRKNIVDSNPITLRNLGKSQGKPQCGETQREREILLLCFMKVQNSSKICISSQGKYLRAPNLSHRNLPCFLCQNRTVVRPLSASFSVPTINCTDYSVRPKNSEQKTKIRLEIRALNASISVPNPYGCTDCTESYRLYRSIQYDLPQQKNISAQNSGKKILGIRALLPWKTCPLCCSLSSLKHAQKISLTLLLMCSQHPPDIFTTCLAHYPMHSFII
jgi:hypothetical protein